MEEQEAEIRRLRGCINDLLSVLSMAAVWSGWSPPKIVATLLDVLLQMLRLDFAYTRLSDVGGSAPIEMIRLGPDKKRTWHPTEVARMIALSLNNGVSIPSHIPAPAGKGELSIAPIWMGLDRELGVVVAGAQREDFPTEIEMVVLKAAVNQAVIELQAEQVRAERKRSEEIEQAKDELHAENVFLRLDTDQHWGEIVGQSRSLKKALKLVEQVAPTNASVLIQGETGTGKELIARAIHRLSQRKQRAFVKLNCAAIPTGLLESELFGHEKGAFTGAISPRAGRFELADKGTLFLDEVGDISLDLQSKLLRVLQEHEFERLGSNRTLRVDVRVLAATNRNLKQMVGEKQFRGDLYYRLNVFPIMVPPLRERAGDLVPLIHFFTQKHARDLNKPITHIAPETIKALSQHGWPGNVRELENFIERCVILSPGQTLEAPLMELRSAPSERARATTLVDAEREHILRALEETRWRLAGPAGAATKLGMKRTSLQYKMQKLGISRPH